MKIDRLIDNDILDNQSFTKIKDYLEIAIFHEYGEWELLKENSFYNLITDRKNPYIHDILLKYFDDNFQADLQDHTVKEFNNDLKDVLIACIIYRDYIKDDPKNILWERIICMTILDKNFLINHPISKDGKSFEDVPLKSLQIFFEVSTQTLEERVIHLYEVQKSFSLHNVNHLFQMWSQK